MMTQDQCLENGHQAASSSQSVNDKTSDDSNNSNNSILKCGVNTTQEFNVDVNSKRIIARNFGADTNSSSTDTVLTTIKNSLDLPPNFADSILNSVLNANNKSLVTKMTVITPQSSGENIREIILHPDDLNEIPNDSQRSIKANIIKEKNCNKVIVKDKDSPKSKSDVSSDNEIDKPEDPIERLNKLRASISSALSEVKGVLKQYSSTEQSFDGEPELSQSSKSADDGPVRFRFVRKIRRRSVFSEENEDVTTSIVGEGVTLDTLSTGKHAEESSNTNAIIKSDNGRISHEQSEKVCSSYIKEDNRDIKSITKDVNTAILTANDNEKKVIDIIPIDKEQSLNDVNVSAIENLQTNFTSENNNKINSSDVDSKNMEMVDNTININNIQNSLSNTKKIAKSKKPLKRNRRFSVTLEKTLPPLDLKVQRRPSDSATIVKHQTGTKSTTCEHPNSTTQEISSIKQINKAETSATNKNLQDAPNLLPELLEVSIISTKAPCSELHEGVKIPAGHITESSIQTLNHRNGNLDIKDFLQPRKPNTKDENKPETKEDVSKPSDTFVQTEQIDQQFITIINQNAEIDIDVKIKIQEDLTSKKDQDSTPSNSVQYKNETANDTTPMIGDTRAVVEQASAKNKKKAKRKVVIRRVKRKLSKEDTFIQVQETPAELEIEEKDIEEQDANEEVAEETKVAPKQRKPCIKARQFDIGDIVMYAERYKKTQVKWRKAKIIERITSISYKLDIDGEEKPAHISYIKKFTNRKVNFGGKEYLEIDYAQIEEDEENERNYSIWNLV